MNEKVSIRRSPKYLAFVITGAMLGVIVALILGLSIPEDQRTAEPIITYLIAYLAAGGAVFGIVLSVVLDRIGLAKAKTAEATKLNT